MIRVRALMLQLGGATENDELQAEVRSRREEQEPSPRVAALCQQRHQRDCEPASNARRDAGQTLTCRAFMRW